MEEKLIDNKQYGRVGDVLKRNIKENSKLSITASYFTLYAFQELKEELSKIDSLRFIYTEPTFVKNDNKNIMKKIKENENKLFGVEEELKGRCTLNQSYIARELAKWVKKKVEIKTLKNTKMNGALCHIDSGGKSVSITGANSLSGPSLGYINSKPMYLNIYTDDNELNYTLKSKFNEIWNNEDLLKDVKKDILNKIKYLYKDNSPEFLYFITLYNIFKDFLEENDNKEVIKSRTGFKDTEVWNRLYNFQKDGVVGAINKIETYGGCIIADSVGLGKTFEALAIIKYYELRNCRVLVLAPKKLRDNWSVYRVNDKRNILAKDRFNYDLLNHTDLSRKGGMSGDIDLSFVNWGNYDLVVIDESHNFRNNVAVNDRETRYEKLMNNIIKAGVKTKVLMLSATPVNNKLDDLKNQLAFITEDDDKALEKTAEIKSIMSTLRNAQSAFNKWGDLEENEKTTERLLDMLNFDYFKLLDSLTIARSRKHIEKYYNINDIGQFPKRLKPENVKEDIDILEDFPSFKEINNQILKLNLSVYAPIKYVLPHKRDYYNKLYDTKAKGGKVLFKQMDREQNIVFLMKTNFLKRLESSINSFTITLEKVLYNINSKIKKLSVINDDITLDIDDIDPLDTSIEQFTIGDKVKIKIKDIDKIKYKQDLEHDRDILLDLLSKSKKIDEARDKKLHELKNVITRKINNPINEDNKKIIIFTAFADTAKYLYKNISVWAKDNYNLNSALVTGSENPKTTIKMSRVDLNKVLINFSPISKEREKVMPEIKEEIDILIATDCISEGQNLQDCDYLINYDIHWNPVRIVQRFGRIDRLGSRNTCIKLVNFWPSMELDEYIHLEGRVKQKMTMLDISATGEEDVINENPQKMKDLEYRRKQLKQLQEEVIDLEEVNGNLSFTDFTLDDFRMDLINLQEKYDSEVENTPLGIYSIVKNNNKSLDDEIKPGVIYCLKKTDSYKNESDKNPIYPYYMAYVKEDGEIIYNYSNVKKILDIYKALCIGNNKVINDLVEEFNEETKNQKKMDKYKDLLTDVTDDILGKIEEQDTLNIFSLGDLSGMLDNNTNQEEFEIVSYLVIK
ncbi:helicase-related protein [Intestinibacter bartlettii]|uniref:helicase-related protein n=1 Tax=Intestinibacter bartlettii TaxID=261299 RepID=UPI002430D045|nr:helicase-related protein [Intestinibacter bartlettii]MDU6822414.1 helicase-related protein [Intestinibacter bartlettii]